MNVHENFYSSVGIHIAVIKLHQLTNSFPISLIFVTKPCLVFGLNFIIMGGHLRSFDLGLFTLFLMFIFSKFTLMIIYNLRYLGDKIFPENFDNFSYNFFINTTILRMSSNIFRIEAFLPNLDFAAVCNHGKGLCKYTYTHLMSSTGLGPVLRYTYSRNCSGLGPELVFEKPQFTKKKLQNPLKSGFRRKPNFRCLIIW